MSGLPSALLWRSLDPAAPMLEQARLPSRTRAEGTVVGRLGGLPFALSYALNLAEDGSPSIADLEVAGGEALTLYRARSGVWSNHAGHHLHALDGCSDLGLRASPITNSLILRRLKLEVGQASDVLTAQVSVPDLHFRAVRQRYTRTGKQTYRLQNLESKLSAELRVDENLLVVDYPDTFERL